MRPAVSALIVVFLLLAPLAAHPLPLEVVAYVKAEGAVLRVIARIPATVLADARLPVRGDGYLDLQALDGPMAAVATYVARSLDVMQDDRPLPAPRTSWVITRPPDSSFDSYESASAHLAAPRLPATSAIDPDKALVDLDLEYPLAPGAGATARFSIRANDFRAALNRTGNTVQMRVHSMLDSGGTRALVMTGAPRRVVLNPEWRSVVPIFGRMGFVELSLAVPHLLFVLCLAIARRSTRSALSLFGVFSTAYLVALAVSALGSGAVESPQALTLNALAAGTLVIAGLQNITMPRFFWMQAVAAVFGVLDGLWFGAAYRLALPFAGSHAAVAFAAFAVPALGSSLWLLLVAKPVVGFVYQMLSVVPGPEGEPLMPGPEGQPLMPGPTGPGLNVRWAVILLSAIVIHAGLHRLGLP